MARIARALGLSKTAIAQIEHERLGRGRARAGG
jgi:DNA-binding XRE family transcriptional regulator